MKKSAQLNGTVFLLLLQSSLGFMALGTPPSEVVTPALEAVARSPLGALLERSGVRLMLLESREGRMLVRNVLDRPRLTDVELTSEVYAEFITAIESPTFAQLRTHLEETLLTAHQEFQNTRRTLTPNLAEELTEAELAVSRELQAAAARFASSIKESAQTLAAESNVIFVPRFVGGPSTAAEALSAAGRQAEVDAARAFDGLVPTLPLNMRTGISDMETARLTFFQNMGLRFRAFRGFYDALKINPATWWKTFRRPTPQWTLEDLKLIRKYNRMLDGLNDYARFHLIMQAFSHERPQIYNMLNEATREATASYMRGEISREAYLAKRIQAAGNEDTFGAVTRRVIARLAPGSAHSLNSARAASATGPLARVRRAAREERAAMEEFTTSAALPRPPREFSPGVPAALIRGETAEQELAGRLAQGQNYFEINEIWKEAERRMLETIEKLNELGGGTHANVHYDGLIGLGRTNFELSAREVSHTEASLRAAEGRLNQLTLSQRLNDRTEYRRRIADLMSARAQRDLMLARHNQNAEHLDVLYAEFASRYETLELFINVQRGRIGSQRVPRFDLPEAFDVSTESILAWTPIYEVARVQAINAEILSETRVFVRARFGAARSFVNDLNKWTSKYFNKRFTETAAGREFMGLADGLAKVILKRASILTGGVAGAIGLSDEEAREAAIRLMRNSWAEVFGVNEAEREPETQTPTTPTAPGAPLVPGPFPTIPDEPLDLPPLPARRSRTPLPPLDEPQTEVVIE